MSSIMRLFNRRFPALMLSSSVLLLAGVAHADTIISSPATSNIGSWGSPASGSTPSYGQVVTVLAGNTFLQSVTYNIDDPNAASINYQLIVYLWNGSAITGPALYTSPTETVGPTGGSYVAQTVSGINTQLTAGNQYVALFTTLANADSVGGLRYQTGTSYAGGLFEYNNSTTLAGLSVPANWNTSGNFGNLAFSMAFTTNAATSTPEPATFGLLGISALALLAGRKLTARR